MGRKGKKIVIGIVIALIIAIVAVFGWFLYLRLNVDLLNVDNPATHTTSKKYTKKDDWVYEPGKSTSDRGFSLGGIFKGYATAESGAAVMDSANIQMNSSVAMSPSTSNIGFSVGGAKDINNFRENIEKNYFPISTDITYNGLFYDYSFDTGMKDAKPSEDLFSPAYSTAISKDPISGKSEYYMTVGLNSNIKESDFDRKKLNLTVVLDISGSMSSGLGAYYYDFDKEDVTDDDKKSKMQLANESLNMLIDELNDEDKLGIVLFDDQAYLAKPLNLIAETDVKALKNHILEIGAQGGTNFEAGYLEATKLYDDLKAEDKDEYENRIIVITDAMPNYGNTSREGLLSYVEKNSKEGIYTTFIGVGVDFNTNLIETLSDVKGTNYYSVHSAKEFKERMGEQFEYMVTPLVFDLNLTLKSDDVEILSVYGSDTVNKENGEIMKVNTLFPSKTNINGEVKGGVVLLKLSSKSDKMPEVSTLNLKVSYEDRNGEKHSNEQTVEFKANEEERYDNTGIRKAISLTRYANTLKNWILHERSERKYVPITPEIGICDCIQDMEEIYILLGEHERASTKLSVSDEYKKIFEDVKIYMITEIDAIGDETMKQEIDILDKLIKY